jgi:hypothetical protein
VSSALTELTRALAAQVPAIETPRDLAAAIEALLAAAPRVAPDLVSSVVDGLERLILSGYRPSEGMSSRETDVQTAAALLAGYDATKRLPYAMLADELMRFAVSHGLDAAHGVDVRVCCRLARLHRHEEFRAAAVIAPGSDYAALARELLASMSAEVGAAGFGLALADCLDLH